MVEARLPASAQVLTNTDLLHGIFTFVPLASTNRDSYLARCATVCHTFHEPAIRVLWRNLRSLLPLWHLLAPSDTPFDADYFSPTRYEVLKYLQKVSRFISHAFRFAHETLSRSFLHNYTVIQYDGAAFYTMLPMSVD